MMVFCTLFDSHYLDKGIVLYRSIEKQTQDFELYIFCFDDRSRDILKDMGLKHAVILHHSDFETERLLEIKKERSKAEYCWTCTPVVIEYVMNHYHVVECTYIDADMRFYHDPKQLFDEITEAGADVAIMEHRFKADDYGKKLEERNGKYCVEFNYFKNSSNGWDILIWWKEKCMEWCYDIPEPERMGDQKYLNDWPERFSHVHVIKHKGGGVAPWNLERYRLDRINTNQIILQEKERFPLIFYHFQNIRYLPGRRVNIKSQSKNKNLKYAIYIPYLKEIEEVRQELKKSYGFTYEERGIVRSSNKIVGFLQKHFAGFKLQSFSDVIRLDRLSDYEIRDGKYE